MSDQGDRPGWGGPGPDDAGPQEPPAPPTPPAQPEPPHPGWSPEQPAGYPPPAPPAPPVPPAGYPPSPGPPVPPPNQGQQVPPPYQGQPAPYPGYQPPPPSPGFPGHPGYSYAPPAAPKPGVIPLRPLGVGEILDGAIQCVRANPKIMLGLSAVVVTVSQLVSFAFTAAFAQDLSSLDPETASPADVLGATGGLLGASFISGVLSALAQVILAGVLTVVVGRAVLGRSITLAEAWAQLRPRIWALIGAAILILLAAGFGLVFCIAPGIYLWVMWWLATPAVVLERAGVITAMRRSWNLVRGAWWRTFLIVLLTWILTLVISGIVAIPFSIVASIISVSSDPTGFGSLSVASLFASTLGSIVGGTLTYPFTAAVTVLVYVDRRMRLEGLDLELARAAAAPPRP